MALSQGLDPDLCENRSAPGTPPHGGAGDAPRRGGGVPGQRPADGAAGGNAPGPRRLRTPRAPAGLPGAHRVARHGAEPTPGRWSVTAPRRTVRSERTPGGFGGSGHGEAPTAAPRPAAPPHSASAWARTGAVASTGSKDGFYPSPAASSGTVSYLLQTKCFLCSPEEPRGSCGGARSDKGCCTLTQQRAVFISHCPVPALPGRCRHCPLHLGLPADTCLYLSVSWYPPVLALPRLTHTMPILFRNTSLQILLFFNVFLLHGHWLIYFTVLHSIEM